MENFYSLESGISFISFLVIGNRYQLINYAIILLHIYYLQSKRNKVNKRKTDYILAPLDCALFRISILMGDSYVFFYKLSFAFILAGNIQVTIFKSHYFVVL